MRSLKKHLSIYWPSLEWGGAERTTLKLIKGITSQGYKVDVLLVRATGALLSEVPNNVRIINFKASRALTSLPGLINYLRQENPDILYSGLHTNIIALWAKRLARVRTKVVLSARGHLTSHINMNSFDFRVRLLPYFVRKFYPWADAIVCVSKVLADDLVQVYGVPYNKVCVINNPVITPELRDLAEIPLDHPWLQAGEPPVLLAAGHLSAVKDFATLLYAFGRVRQTHQCRLIVLGEGEERHKLETVVKQLHLEEDVQLPGFILNPLPYMKRASIFVLSSRWEGLPGVLIEALYCGLPIIATDCPGGSREILADGKYGQLVPVGDPIAMAKAIESYLVGNAIKPPEESWKRFTLGCVINQYEDVFAKLLDPRSNQG